ncbi:LysR family transcriptional regulator [Rhodobacter sp. SY28-1]|uniref:LysR family transcriptional regulator n=1 Tax=Rhodobacter sp. SY28-1 TaxID=2562317 RepID=UPI0010C06B84|nr:LysR family transcriptional regulator [Rhodobacter sp. SY28-1]
MIYRNLNHLATFAALAETGSFARAARRLQLPTSTVSEHVAALEKNLGLQLVIRTTRSNRLTEAGQILAQGAARMMVGVAETLAGVEVLVDRPTGTLRLSLPFAFAADIVGPAVARFAALYPGIRLDIVVSNEVEDLIAGGFDLAVRIGPLEDSSLTRRGLGTMPMDLVANPAYLAARGRPGRLTDLAGHCLVGIRPTLSLSATGPGGPETVPLDAQVAVNDPKTMVSILRGRGGIGVVPRFLAQAGLDDGSLEILLPEYRLPSAEMSVVYYGSGTANPRADLFASFLQSEMRDRATNLRR